MSRDGGDKYDYVGRLRGLLLEINAGINGEGDPSRPDGEDASALEMLLADIESVEDGQRAGVIYRRALGMLFTRAEACAHCCNTYESEFAAGVLAASHFAAEQEAEVMVEGVPTLRVMK